MTTTKQKSAQQVSKDAEALVHERALALRMALDTEKALNARVNSGDDSVSTADLTNAATASRRAGALLTASREALDAANAAASREVAKESPDVAQAVVRLLRDNAIALGLHGIPIELVDDLPKEMPERIPAVYVTQNRATSHDLTVGTASGEAVMRFIAPVSLVDKVGSIRQGLRDVGKAAQVADFDFGSIPGRSLGEGVHAWETIVTAKNLRATIPVLAGEPQPFRVDAIRNVLRDVVAETAGVTRFVGVGIGQGDASGRASVVHVYTEDLTTKKVETDRDGITRRTVEVILGVTSAVLDADRLRDNTQRALGSLEGRFISGVGRIASVEALKMAPIPSGREMSVRIVLLSRKA